MELNFYQPILDYDLSPNFFSCPSLLTYIDIKLIKCQVWLINSIGFNYM